MNSTPFSRDNSDFTRHCHILAQTAVYPALFGVPYSRLTFDDQTIKGNGSAEARYFDGELGIDQRVYVQYDDLRAPVPFTIQERFQRPTHADKRNITITEWNPHSDTPSEMYKCHAHFFVCGFIDIESSRIIELVTCPVSSLMPAIGHRKIALDRRPNPRTGQPFLRIEIEELLRAGLVHLHIRDNRVILPAPKQGRRIRNTEDFIQLWPAVLIRMKKEFGLARVAFFYDACPVVLTDTDAVIEFQKEFHYAKACEAAQQITFERVLDKCMATPHRLRFQLRQTAPLPPAPADKDEDIKQIALDMFGAEIIGTSKQQEAA